MKLKQIKSNMTELWDNSGNVILFSYETPVAANLASGGFIKTATKWSRTTSRHITQWLDGARAVEVDQSMLNELVQ